MLASFSLQQRDHALGELALLTNLSKPTLFRILQTLEKHKSFTYDPHSNRRGLFDVRIHRGSRGNQKGPKIRRDKRW